MVITLLGASLGLAIRLKGDNWGCYIAHTAGQYTCPKFKP